MSNNPRAAAIGRVQAAGEADVSASPTAILLRELADIAVLIERLETLIAGDVAAEPDCSSAIERIADIAFMLHERDVEHSLCDALDAAVREISSAGARRAASARQTHAAGDLLRELEHRINTMAIVAVREAIQRPERSHNAQTANPALDKRTIGETKHESSFHEHEDEHFSQAVGSLPSLPTDLHARDAAVEPSLRDSARAVSADDLASSGDGYRSIAEPQPIGSDSDFHNGARWPDKTQGPAVGPDEDPRDLFEPLATWACRGPESVLFPSAAAGSHELQSGATGAPRAELAPVASCAADETDGPEKSEADDRSMPSAEPRPANAAPSVPRSGFDDPLAPLMALSEAELIALFS